MATPIIGTNEVLKKVSGITWFDVYGLLPTDTKNLSELVESDWHEIAGFREGTMNFTGDEQTTTDHKYENGMVYWSTTKDGTYAFEGNIPNVHSEILKHLLKMNEVDTTAWTGDLKGFKIMGYGDKVAYTENIYIRLRFEMGDYVNCIYPNATLSARFQGPGTSDNHFDIKINGKALLSEKSDTKGKIFLLTERISENAKVIIETEPASDVESTAATLEGRYTKMGTNIVSEIGFAYIKEGESWASATEAKLLKVPIGAFFTSKLASLTPLTKYMFRAYAKVGSDVFYGSIKDFTTDKTA